MATQSPTLEYLTTTHIGEKGQLTVPKTYRDSLGLESGAPVAVLRLGDGLLLLPEQRRFDQLCQQLSAALVAAQVTLPDLLEGLPEIREQILEERYGSNGSSDNF